MVDFNDFVERFMRTMQTCNVPTMPLRGVNPASAGLEVSCDYQNSIMFMIADGCQRAIGFSDLIAYKGSGNSLNAVKLNNATDKCVSISESLGMIYGAPYKRIVKKGGTVVYYI